LELRRLGKQKNLAFKKGFLGKTVEVLIENTRDKETGYLKGITDNYIKVLIQGTDERMNNYYQVKVAAIKSDKVYGVWVQ
jgi:threonylcarbamoyladenosine tRNA methylthiotransferase MtaB